ncbi:hypothetical protein [Tepidibacter sp. Z1-5]|uniref:hypothetical protein n=1 Tax=Tepidibacter sp. Z1-5 TaxID=3134138 RepID=UPI0030C4B706
MCTKSIDIFFDSYSIGAKDRNNREIKEIYKHVRGSCIVYTTTYNYINAHIERVREEDLPISKEIEDLVLKIDLLKPDNIEENSYIATSICQAIIQDSENNTEMAISILEDTIKNIKKVQNKNYIHSYLPTIVIITIITSALSLFTYYYNWFLHKNFLRELIFCVSFSTCGTLLNHLVSTYSLNEKPKEHSSGFIGAINDTLRSSLNGVLIYTLIKSNIILGNFGDTIEAMCVLSFVTGFKDEIIIRLMEKLAESILKDS